MHYLGPEKELALLSLFAELAVLMPALKLEITMVRAGTATFEPPPPVTYNGR